MRLTEARYRELLEAAPPVTRKEYERLRGFVPRRSVLAVSVMFALRQWYLARAR